MPTYYSTCFVIIHSTEDGRSSVETCFLNLKKWSFSLKFLHVCCYLDLLKTRIKMTQFVFSSPLSTYIWKAFCSIIYYVIYFSLRIKNLENQQLFHAWFSLSESLRGLATVDWRQILIKNSYFKHIVDTGILRVSA